MKRILLSLLVVGVVGGAALAGSRAFFSDTETSTGNTFTAGDIDLKIDNASYALDYNIPGYEKPIGAFVHSNHTTWELSDLTVQKFFDFIDLKPGDYGEDTISVHVGSNNAWMCAAAQLTDDNDVDYTEPEQTDDTTVDVNNPTTTDGELDNDIHFAFWIDDGDNVLETDEADEGLFLSGPLSNLGSHGKIAIADTDGGIFGTNTPVPGDTTFYIGKAWCYGTMTPAPATQDNTNTGSPLSFNTTGFNCDGSQVNNAGQTDKVVGDLQFYAVQARNNNTFTCREWSPIWPSQNN